MTNGVMKGFDGRDEIDNSFVYLVCLQGGCMILPGMFNLFCSYEERSYHVIIFLSYSSQLLLHFLITCTCS
jgi:hypothetical protein